MDMAVFDVKFEKSLVAVLSRGLPLVSRPYEAIAKQLDSTETRVIEGVQNLMNRGDMKRFGVVVRHRQLGYRANGMVVWDIPDQRLVELGKCIGQYSFVTLCYQRPRRLPDWPYNLFSMVHGHDRDAVIQQVETIIKKCGLEQIKFDVLFSGRCFKQRGASYSGHQGQSSPEAAINSYGKVVNE